jgi:hypothetical protein
MSSSVGSEGEPLMEPLGLTICRLASCQPESLWRNLEADLMRLPSRLMPDPTSRPQAEETGRLREPDFLGIGFGQA